MGSDADRYVRRAIGAACAVQWMELPSCPVVVQCADGAARAEAMVPSAHYATSHHLLLDYAAQVACRVPKKLCDKKAVYPHEETILDPYTPPARPQNNIIAPSSAPA